MQINRFFKKDNSSNGMQIDIQRLESISGNVTDISLLPQNVYGTIWIEQGAGEIFEVKNSNGKPACAR